MNNASVPPPHLPQFAVAPESLVPQVATRMKCDVQYPTLQFACLGVQIELAEEVLSNGLLVADLQHASQLAEN